MKSRRYRRWAETQNCVDCCEFACDTKKRCSNGVKDSSGRRKFQMMVDEEECFQVEFQLRMLWLRWCLVWFCFAGMSCQSRDCQDCSGLLYLSDMFIFSGMLIFSFEFLHLWQDIDLYYASYNTLCVPWAKTWNISDDLGQIEYIFRCVSLSQNKYHNNIVPSDKTHTLTQNVMDNSKLPATAYLALQPMPPCSDCPASSVHDSQHATHSCTTSPHVHRDSSQCTTHPCTTGTHEHLNPHAIPPVPPNPQASCDAGTECSVSLFARLHCNFLNAFLNTTHCIYVE